MKTNEEILKLETGQTVQEFIEGDTPIFKNTALTAMYEAQIQAIDELVDSVDGDKTNVTYHATKLKEKLLFNLAI